jgi:flagellar P-ring protein FlgI
MLNRYVLIILCIVCASPVAMAERIKDLMSISGMRSNQLIGYGLVVGLDGTGDQTSQAPFTTQSIKSMLSQFGITIPDGVNPQLKNVAAVTVQAEIPAFKKQGQTIDVTVSSIGNSKSLRGGSLLMTPLKGIDGNVYAIAQGNMVVGGLGISGKDGSNITINIPSTGRIPNGATVEREVLNTFGGSDFVILNLNEADFTTGSRMSYAINDVMGDGVAIPIDSASIRVNVPMDPGQRVEFLSRLENLTLTPGEVSAKIVVNSRTGTVVVGQNVLVSMAAVSHGSLMVRITEDSGVSQPQPFSRNGDTVVVQNSDITIEQKTNPMFLLNPGVSLNDIVRAVNEVGASPADLIAILEALKQAGALKAELIII